MLVSARDEATSDHTRIRNDRRVRGDARRGEGRKASELTSVRDPNVEPLAIRTMIQKVITGAWRW